MIGAAATSRSCPSAVSRSAASATTLAPVSCPIRSALASSFAWTRPLITTEQPARASSTAQPSPRPWLDAHTTAVRPASRRSSPIRPEPSRLSAPAMSWAVTACTAACVTVRASLLPARNAPSTTRWPTSGLRRHGATRGRFHVLPPRAAPAVTTAERHRPSRRHGGRADRRARRRRHPGPYRPAMFPRRAHHSGPGAALEPLPGDVAPG